MVIVRLRKGVQKVSCYSLHFQVDNQLLEGFTNQESVDILRNTGQVVRLKLARYKYGRKHDLLTQSTGQGN